MNTVRLVLGWLFLAGFTAAGTYYAMDEVDSRVGLARFHLHEKLGFTRYAAVSPPPVNNQVPVSNPTQVIVPAGQGGQPNSQTPPVQIPPPQIVQPPAAQNPPPPIISPSQTQPQPIVVTPPVQIPPQNTTPPPVRNPQQQPQQRPVYTPQQQIVPAPSRPQDYTETNERLIEVKSRAEGVRKVWADTLRNVPSPRSEITGALAAMRRYTQQAEQSLQSGDTASARRYLDQAEKQMEILQTWRE